MVNRLEPILDEIISPGQSAFVPTRRITDNALIAFECVHSIKYKAGNRGEFCAYKLDLSKAFDHVDWGFLKSAMEKLGFHNTWVPCHKQLKKSYLNLWHKLFQPS
jgi:hypothetical protein